MFIDEDGEAFLEVSVKYPVIDLESVQNYAEIHYDRKLTPDEILILEEKLGLLVEEDWDFSKLMRMFEWHELAENEVDNIKTGVYTQK